MARRSSGRRGSARRGRQASRSRIAGLLRPKRVKVRKKRVTAGGPRRHAMSLMTQSRRKEMARWRVVRRKSRASVAFSRHRRR